MWTLPPPPGFQGLQPHKPLTLYQRHLPHWRQDGATYFVTYRLADALPQSKLDELQALKAEWQRQPPRETPPRTGPAGRPTQAPLRRTALLSRLSRAHAVLEERARQVQERVERWLDQGMGSCVLQQPAVAALVTSAMHHFDDEHYELGCYVVMPNHVHAVVRPLMPVAHPLEEILGGWKKYSSRRINSVLNTTGALWQEESYDRIVRDEEHLWRVIQYIGSNPERAGLPRDLCRLWARPQWVELGWKFEALEGGQPSGIFGTALLSRPTGPLPSARKSAP